MSTTMSYWNRVLHDARRREAYTKFVRTQDAGLGAFLEFDPARRLDPPLAEHADPGDVSYAGSVSRARSRGAAAGGETPESALAGVPFAVKDNIAVAGFNLTCASRILEELQSPYTATAVRRMEAAGARVVGKTNLDEFGMGSSTDNSALGVTHNPYDHTRVAGGSSGGSAAAVAAGLVPVALGSDTGGSVRQPASFCGVYGLKPTYGAVSRYGLVAFASSLDVVGVCARELSPLQAVFNVIRGLDERDHTSQEPVSGPSAKVSVVGVLTGLQGLDPAVRAAYERTVEYLQGLGYALREVELSTLKYVVPAYYTIATAEASANLARYNGVRYGLRPERAENPDELVRIARDEGLGPEVKLRILLGTYVLRSGFQDQYYLRAQRIRTAIRNELARAFDNVQAILTPTVPVLPFAHGEGELTAFQQKLADIFTATASLAGIPALSVPCESTTGGLPVGMQLLAPAFAEERLFAVAGRLAEAAGERGLVARPENYPPLPDWAAAKGYELDWS